MHYTTGLVPERRCIVVLFETTLNFTPLSIFKKQAVAHSLLIIRKFALCKQYLLRRKNHQVKELQKGGLTVINLPP